VHWHSPEEYFFNTTAEQGIAPYRHRYQQQQFEQSLTDRLLDFRWNHQSRNDNNSSRRGFRRYCSASVHNSLYCTVTHHTHKLSLSVSLCLSLSLSVCLSLCLSLALEMITELDTYMTTLTGRDNKHRAKYTIVLSDLFNALSYFAPRAVSERGNCAYWTSKVGSTTVTAINHTNRCLLDATLNPTTTVPPPGSGASRLDQAPPHLGT
jgi:hypothetical protein